MILKKIWVLIVLISCQAFSKAEECQADDKRPLHGECEWHQICREGRYVPRRCPTDNLFNRMMFNPQTNNCTTNMKLTVEDKCHSYRQCVVIDTVSPFLKWTEVACGAGLHFDQERQACVDSVNSTCVSKACDTSKCQNGGRCQEEGNDMYTCLCPSGFTGHNCEYANNPCAANACNNHGACFADHMQNTHCFCEAEFGGENCEIDVRPTTTPTTTKDYDFIPSHTLSGHTEGVISVAFNNANILASGSEDKTIKLWNPSTGDLLRTLSGHTDGVISVAFNNANILASGSYDTTIRLWNPSTGDLLRTLSGHTYAVYSVAFNNANILASGSDDTTIKLWV